MDDDALRSQFIVSMATAEMGEKGRKLVHTILDSGGSTSPATLDMLRDLTWSVISPVEFPDDAEHLDREAAWADEMTIRVAELVCVLGFVADLAAATIRTAREYGVNIDFDPPESGHPEVG